MKTVLLRSAVLSGALALAIAPFASATSSVNQTAVTNGANYITSQQTATGSVSASASDNDFAAIALVAAGQNLANVKLAGGTSLLAYEAANLPGASAKASDWERTILVAAAAGQDPYNFGGTDAVAKLKTFASAGQLGDPASTGDDIFGIMALAAAGVTSADAVMSAEIAAVLSYQRPDGRFSYSTDPTVTGDVDDTAAAIVALRSAEIVGGASPAVTTAINNALDYIAALKNTDGGYPSDPAWDTTSNVASSAWVLIALNSLGLGDSADGRAAQSYIKSQQLQDGSFPSSWAPTTGDFFDTNPAVTALAGSTWLPQVFEENTYAGTAAIADAESPSPSVSPSVSPTPTPAQGAVLGASTVTPTPTPTATPASAASTATGTVLGATALPVVGQVSNAVLLLWAVAVALTAAVLVSIRQYYVRRQS